MKGKKYEKQKNAKRIIKPVSAMFIKVNYFNSPYKKYLIIKK